VNKALTSLLIACGAFPAFLLVLSCPNPIDSTLARKVEDTAAPVIRILEPNPEEKNYFGSEITVAGIVTDYADSAARVPGAVQSLSYEEQYNKRIHGSVTPAGDGSFAFSFSAIDPEMLSGTQVIVLTAVDWNGNSATDFVTLYDKTSGPIIVVFDHGPTDYNVYSSALDAPISIAGRVEVPTTTLTYDVEPAAGPAISGRLIPWDPVTGDFQFPFNPVTAGVSGQLRFVLKAFDGKDSSTVFILTDDPVAPRLNAGTVDADNSCVNLQFSKGIYHAGGTDPLSADFSLAFTKGSGTADGAAAAGLIGTPAGGDTSLGLGITVLGLPNGAETITITASGLTDRVGNPLAPAYDSLVLSLKDKTAPSVLRVNSSLPAGSAHRAGETVPVTVTFNEPVTVTPPLTMDLNVGAAAAYAFGSGTSAITLNYTIQAGHNADPLNYEVTTALAGTVVDLQGNAALLALPDPVSADALAARYLRIDTSAPAAPAVQILDSGDELINKTENQTGVSFTVTGEDGAGYDVSLTNCTLSAGSASGTLPAGGLALRATATGTVTVSATLTDDAGNTSPAGSDTCEANLTAPNPPVVTGPSHTNDQTPTWEWTSGGGGNGTFRYRLDNGDLSGEPETTASSYAPPADLGEGGHILYVQERNAFGNWSESGSRTITIDITPPNSPDVSTPGANPTNNTTVTWEWSSGGGGGNGLFRHRLDIDELNGEPQTVSTSYSPTLGAGDHTLYVQERDAAGSWSGSGSWTITIDLTAPAAPEVSTVQTSPTTEKRPTWNWTSAGEGSGVFRFRLDNPDLSGQPETSALSYRPAANLSLGPYTLYVQERDDAGNWSESGFAQIEIE
jgi:hypothetical protein